MIAEFLRKLPMPNKAIVTSRHRVGESAFTLRLDHLLEAEAFALMAEVGRRQPRIAAKLRNARESASREPYEAAGGNPLALTWTLGLVAQKGYSLAAALERLKDAARSSDLYGFLFAGAVRNLARSDRAVLSALSAFRSPATPAALADATDLANTEVRIALERLVTLSLVNDLEGERYGLHPLTRAYVQAALGTGSEAARVALGGITLDPAARRKALRYWVDCAQSTGVGLKTPIRPSIAWRPSGKTWRGPPIPCASSRASLAP
jgi:hypothetical protein